MRKLFGRNATIVGRGARRRHCVRVGASSGLERLESRELLTAIGVTGVTAISHLSWQQRTGGYASNDPVINADGRYTLFQTGSQLVPSDTNGINDVYRYDRTTDTIELVTRDGSGNAIGSSGSVGNATYSISGDGRYVAFQTSASFGGSDTNGAADVYVRDMVTGGVTLVSANAAGNAIGGSSARISENGGYIVFQSTSASVVSGQTDTNGTWDVFRRNLVTGVTQLVSSVVGSATTAGNGVSFKANISGDGTTVAFVTDASNLISTDSNGHRDVYVRSFGANTMVDVSLFQADVQDTTEAYTTYDTHHWAPQLSDDGRAVVFHGYNNSLYVANSTTPSVHSGGINVDYTFSLTSPSDGAYDFSFSGNGNFVAFESWQGVRRANVATINGTFAFDSITGGPSGTAYQSFGVGISDDGSRVAYQFNSSPANEAFVWNSATNSAVLVSAVSDLSGNAVAFNNNARPVLSGDGNYVAMESAATNGFAFDPNGAADVFLAHYQPTNSSPRGNIDLANLGHVAGWTFDTNVGATPIQVRIDVDGVKGTPSTASLSRPDIAGLNNGTNHGFDLTPPSNLLTIGNHSVSVYFYDNNGDAQCVGNWNVSTGSIDTISPNRISGWAMDPRSGSGSINVKVYIDDPNNPFNLLTTVAANLTRSDLSSMGYGTAHGYDIDLTALPYAARSKMTTGVQHTLYLVGVDSVTGQETLITSNTFTNSAPIGSVDSWSRTTVAGWALDLDARADTSPGRTGERVPLTIVVYMDTLWDANKVVATGTANLSRPDVDATYHLGADYGFSLAINQSILTAGSHTLYVCAVDSQSGLMTVLGSHVV